LLDAEGKLTPQIIDQTAGMLCSRTIARRFGSLRKAYELIGYRPAKIRGVATRIIAHAKSQPGNRHGVQ
jgi:hypothetical protein